MRRAGKKTAEYKSPSSNSTRSAVRSLKSLGLHWFQRFFLLKRVTHTSDEKSVGLMFCVDNFGRMCRNSTLAFAH